MIRTSTLPDFFEATEDDREEEIDLFDELLLDDYIEEILLFDEILQEEFDCVLSEDEYELELDFDYNG